MECVHDQNCSIHIGDGAVQLADDIPLRQENRNCIILCEEQAAEMMRAGASLVEIYSGFIYEGPGLVRRINNHLKKENL